VLLCTLATSAEVVGEKAKQPHILFLLADDLGFGDVGYTGSSIKTPVIDSLAKAGTVMGHYYVMHCCSPTRAAFQTGRYNIRYGLQTQVIPSNKRYGLNLNETTIANYLKSEGYATHAVGKWHLGVWRWEHTPTFRGYDSFLGYYGGSEDYYKHSAGQNFDFRNDKGAKCGEGCSTNFYVNHTNALFSYPRFIASSGKKGLYLEDNRTKPATINLVKTCNMCGRDLCASSMRHEVRADYLASLSKGPSFKCSMLTDIQPLSDGYSTPLYAIRATQIIAEHDASTPLFLFMPFQAVHEPIQAPDRYVVPYSHLDPNRRMFAGMLAALDEAIGQVGDITLFKTTLN
jgi:hypothetical protein